jgi:hypothetical protein
MLVLAAGCMELLGGVLFTLNLKFGAFLLVSSDGAASRSSCLFRIQAR